MFGRDRYNLGDMSENILGLEYSPQTGVLSLSSGYIIPTTTQEANWNEAYGLVNYINQAVKTTSSPSFVRGTFTEDTLSPFAITSTVVNTNLNADLLDGNHAAAFALVGQTMYIGTTAVAINRESGTLDLAGIGTLGAGAITCTTLNNTGALYEKITSTSDATYTVLVTDRYIYVTASTDNNKVVALPAATGSGRILTIKKLDSSTATVTIDGNASETIDGETTFVLSMQYESITIQDAASGVWYIN